VEFAGQAVAGLGGLHFVGERTRAIGFPLVLDDGLKRAWAARTDGQGGRPIPSTLLLTIDNRLPASSSGTSGVGADAQRATGRLLRSGLGGAIMAIRIFAVQTTKVPNDGVER
jgi:hypothetical protein